ncbi:MAG: hypothetical protein VKL41_14405 [Snowella sp.]|nr:hypothetical protein [Snowella sp.]
MKFFTAIVEKDIDTNLYVGYVLGEALMKAIAEGLDDENVSREEVFALLSE